MTEGETEVIGLVFAHGHAPEPSDTVSMTEVLATAPIVASFRSAREAWAVSAETARSVPTDVRWYAATYDGNWTFCPTKPPREDRVPYPDHNAGPIGDPDRGIAQGSTLLFVLPPPLQSRGVAVSRRQGKANSLPAAWPRDLTLSVFTSWDDIEIRLDDILIDGKLVGWNGAGFYCWSDGQLTSLPWNARSQLKEAPD